MTSEQEKIMEDMRDKIVMLTKKHTEYIFLLKVAFADLSFAAPYFKTYQGLQETANSIMEVLVRETKANKL